MPTKTKKLSGGGVPESVIQAQILSWLKDSGTLHWRQQSGTVFLGRRCIKLGPDGLPDIVVILPPTGHVLGLEVKSESGALRPSQKLFKTSLESVGGTYVVVRSLEQAMNAVAETLGETKCKQKQELTGSTKKGNWPSYGPN